MAYTELHKSVLTKTDLQPIMDFRFDVVEIPAVENIAHPLKCPKLTAAGISDNCNYIADGANLCAEKNSKDFEEFLLCMYSTAGLYCNRTGGNPLCHPDEFDSQIGKCGKALRDYAVEDLKACTYGQEAAQLRKTSAAKWIQWNATHPPSHRLNPLSNVVWVVVAGKEVPAPISPLDGTTMAQWSEKVIAAVCAAYDGTKPASCKKV